MRWKPSCRLYIESATNFLESSLVRTILRQEIIMEILPAIDLRGGNCVRLKQGDYAQETVFGDDPVEMALRWESEGATRLHLVDLDGAKAGRPVNIDAIKGIVQAVKIPCELGGGLRDRDTIRMMLEEVGVDRAIIGTQALKRTGMVS